MEPDPVLGGIFEKTFYDHYSIECNGNITNFKNTTMKIGVIEHEICKDGEIDSDVIALFMCISKLCKELGFDYCKIRMISIDHTWRAIGGMFSINGLIVRYFQRYQSNCVLDRVNPVEEGDKHTDKCISELNNFMQNPNFKELISAMEPMFEFYSIRLLPDDFICVKFGEKWHDVQCYYGYMASIIENFALINNIILIDNVFYCDVETLDIVNIGEHKIEFYSVHYGYIDNDYDHNIVKTIFENQELDRYRKPVKIAIND